MTNSDLDYSESINRVRKTHPKSGRSGETIERGRAKKWKLEGAFFGLTHSLIGSPAYQRLNTPARKIFDFLVLEHLAHGGAENGNLAAPYRQLQIFGISSRDIPKAFLMLDTYGLVKRTNGAFVSLGRQNMARYRLTMVPDKFGNLPTDDWKNVTLAKVEAYKTNPTRQPE